MLIHRDALAVSDALMKEAEEGRYALHAALFDKKGRAVATDGHMLVRFTGEQCKPADFPTIEGLDVGKAADVMVGFAELRAATRTLPPPSSVRPFNFMAVVPNGKNVTLATSDGTRRVQVTAPKAEGEFPAYEKILKVDVPVVAEVTLNPDLLYRLAVIAQKLKIRSIKFVLHAKEGETQVLNQVMFSAQGTTGTIDGAIMPMRP